MKALLKMTLAASALALSVPAYPALAGPKPACQTKLDLAWLEGTYTAIGSMLKMSLAGVTHFDDERREQTVTLSLAGNGKLTLTGLQKPIGDITFAKAGNFASDWTWTAEPRFRDRTAPDSDKSSADIAQKTGCDLSEIPWIAATFTTHAQDDTELNHTIRLMVLDVGYLPGRWTWKTDPDGPNVKGTRSFALFRKE